MKHESEKEGCSNMLERKSLEELLEPAWRFLMKTSNGDAIDYWEAQILAITKAWFRERRSDYPPRDECHD